MQYVSSDDIVAAISDEMSLNDWAATELYERAFVREERTRPNVPANRTKRNRSQRLPGQSARMRIVKAH